ncbi:MAG TPA: M23 family metallopeptidase [Spirochaetota bacterium]|nr:M23 family metallopeptidase [Spirochaetota bacterium]HOK92608.1 M23 family metallopeptidase [Spirochaetota bacterium]HPP94953.1 M23 family metallopeptidase [Spirochaetota bacterium]
MIKLFQRTCFFVIFLIFSLCCSQSQLKSDELKSKEEISPYRLYEQRAKTIIKKPEDFVPKAPETLTLSNSDVVVNIYARDFAQGNIGYIEIIGLKSNLSVDSAAFNESLIPLSKIEWGYRGFFAISPDLKPGLYKMKLSYSIENIQKSMEGEVKIREVKFPVSTVPLDLGKFSDKEYTQRQEFQQYIEDCAKRRTEAFRSMSEDSITNSLSHPRDIHKITSEFWKKRVYMTYKRKAKKKVAVPGHSSIHRGLDLRGDTGSPVFAMASGKVVLAYKMFYEGNMVIIDHGNGVFTYYMHMDSIEISEGQHVAAGDLIGRVGSTGTSTAPHLHVALYVRGIHLDPLSLLSLPVSR